MSIIYLFLFCFYQKPAYEMRISDWSSDVCSSDLAHDVLCAHIEASDGRLRGIRHATVFDREVKVPTRLTPPVEGLMRNREFKDGLACLGRLDLSVDIWVYHPQLDELVSLVREFPQIRFVVDHIGGVLGLGRYRRRRQERSEEHTSEIQSLMRNSYAVFCFTKTKTETHIIYSDKHITRLTSTDDYEAHTPISDCSTTIYLIKHI